MKLTIVSAALILARLALTPAFAERLDLHVAYAGASFDPVTGSPVVNVRLERASGQAFFRFTREHVGKVIDIYVGDEILTSPLVMEPIGGGEIQISGPFDTMDASELAVRLRSGEAHITVAPQE